ncbi:MAG: hypothetical protein U5K31_02850 [Balneolaceae bacterium]|nr:hypothetical protein [Balneolaceae bacterium]
MLHGAWERLRRKYLAASLLFTLLAPVAGFALLSLLESELWLPAWAKTALVALFAVTAAGTSPGCSCGGGKRNRLPLLLPRLLQARRNLPGTAPRPATCGST